MDSVEESVGGTKMTEEIQMVLKVQKQWFLGPLLPLSVNRMKIENNPKLIISKQMKDKNLYHCLKKFLYFVKVECGMTMAKTGTTGKMSMELKTFAANYN